MAAAIDVGVALARAAVFVFSLQAAGAALFLLLLRRQVSGIDRGIRRIIAWSAGAAVLLIVLRSGLEPARMAGRFAGVSDPFLRDLFWESDVSTVQLVRLAGVLLLLATVRLSLERAGLVWWTAIGMIVLSFTLMGHTHAHESSAILGVLLAIHLTAAAFWFGSLLPLLVALRHESRNALLNIIGEFSRLAVWLVPVLLAAGVTTAWALLSSFERLLSPYGLLLLTKLGGFVGLLGLATMNRYRLTPALAAGRRGAVSGLRRTIGGELALMVAVLIATAFMTTLYSPD